MAWNIHWQTAFKSKDNKNYVVNIYEQDYSGNIVQLTPAEEPFITRENSSNDVFTVIRDQTGYLSVIVDDIATIEAIMPQTDTDRFIRLIENNSVKWQGFLSMQNYKQPYNEYKWKVEFALNSMLAMTKKIKLPWVYGVSSIRYTLAYIFSYIYGLAGVTPRKIRLINPCRLYSGIIKPSDPDYYQHYPDDTQLPLVSLSGFFIGAEFGLTETYAKENYIEKKQRMFDVLTLDVTNLILEEILKVFGACLREEGEDLIVALYNNEPSGGGTNIYDYEWSNFIDTNSNVYSTLHGIVRDIVKDGTLYNASINYIKGDSNVHVSFKPEKGKAVIWRLPKTIFNSNQVVTQENHSPFWDYYQIPLDIDTSLSGEKFIWYFASPYDGATPVEDYSAARSRYYFYDPDDPNDTWFGAIPMWQCVTYNGEFDYKFNGLYMQSFGFPHYPLQWGPYLYSFKFNIPQKSIGKVKLYLQLFRPVPDLTIVVDVINNGEYYAGVPDLEDNLWRDGVDHYIHFLRAYGDEGADSKYASLSIDISGREGDIEVKIYTIYDNNEYGVQTCIEDIWVESEDTTESIMQDYNYISAFPLIEENVYDKIVNIDANIKAINTKIGTFNFNALCPNILRQNNYFIDQFTWGDGSHLKVEEMLAECISNYYANKRKVITIPYVGQTVSKIIIYNDGNHYMAIEEERNWRDDKVKVKYIEIL